MVFSKKKLACAAARSYYSGELWFTEDWFWFAEEGSSAGGNGRGRGDGGTGGSGDVGSDGGLCNEREEDVKEEEEESVQT